MRQKLKKCCEIYKIKYLVPKIDVKTRWNSTFEMIDRGAYLKVPLRTLCNDEKTLNPLQITDDEWKMLQDINKILVNFKRATEHISMGRHPTIASYIPTFDFLVSILKKCANENSVLSSAAREGLEKLHKYKLDVNDTILPFIATVLHPGLKCQYFVEHKYPSSTIRDIKKKISEYFLTRLRWKRPKVATLRMTSLWLTCSKRVVKRCVNA